MALTKLVQANCSSSQEAGVIKLSDQAIIATLKISNLQAPHISESSDEKMTVIELAMRAEEEKAIVSLKGLSSLIQGQGKSSLDEATAAFAEFMKVNAEVVRLSRQNSNVKSMEISLGQKRKLTAECEDDLNSLQEIVRSRDFKGTK